MSDDSSIGTHVVAISARQLGVAVDQLRSIDSDRLLKLRVKSGEHLAAILLTAFLGAPPVEMDEDGGMDFVFQLDLNDDMRRVFSGRPRVAFEAKSLVGDFRRKFSQMEEIDRSGGSSIGMGTSVVVQYARDIIEAGLPQLRRCVDQFDRKSVGADCSRNSFLIVHPFESFALETITSTFMAPHMPEIPPDINLDTVWVLWVPDHLTMWSRQERQWSELIFTAFDPDDPLKDAYRDHELSALQIASSELLSAIGVTRPDPYNFVVRADIPEESD
ncbi:hypothetical protein [Actinoplanes sp. CA-252034]|uniref:hypothetical protein n=1 Tax=Actinoplanes sp. CA-252034 TaxID=3239906 RepID=UPI003D950CE1